MGLNGQFMGGAGADMTGIIFFHDSDVLKRVNPEAGITHWGVGGGGAER